MAEQSPTVTLSSTSTTPLDELVGYRRHFHAQPELSMEEFKTAAFIERELRSFGVDEIRARV